MTKMEVTIEKKRKRKSVKDEPLDGDEESPIKVKKEAEDIEVETVEDLEEAKVSLEQKKGDNKKEYRLAKMGLNLTEALKKQAKAQIMTYKEGVEKIKIDPKCGLKEVSSVRHVALPFHMMAKGASKQAVQFIANSSVGKYRKESNGVIVAVGKIKSTRFPRVVDDQNVFHSELFIKQIVFSPTFGRKYEAVVRHISKDIVIALILDVITAHVPVSVIPEDIGLNVGDTIEIVHRGMRIKNALCQLNSDFSRVIKRAEIIVEKSSNRTEFKDEDEEDDDGDE